MKAIFAIGLTAALLGSLTAWAQVTAAPPQTSTGPTVPPEPRQTEQSLAPPSSAGPSMTNTQTHDNWRASKGLNSDPNNPSGAPGSSAIGTAPTR